MWVTPEQIENAKRTDLLTYLQVHEPDNLQRIGNDTYCTKEHDSLKISNGLWHWFSHHIGGKNALDYLIKVKGFSFIEAVLILDGLKETDKDFSSKHDVPKHFELPELNQNIKRVKRYLMNRGIDERLIDYCHKEGVLFEDKEHHNCVFLGKDENGVPKFGSLRSTTTEFKRDLDGSDKRYSFNLCLKKEFSTLHVFEAVIDLLSYITLSVKANREWYKDGYLSLGGVYVSDKKQDVPLALISFLEKRPGTKTVCLHLDNDETGRKATTQIADALKGKYLVVDDPPESGKDYNDYLRNQIKKQKERER